MPSPSLTTSDLQKKAYQALSLATTNNPQIPVTRIIAITSLIENQTNISELATILHLLTKEIPEFDEVIIWFKKIRMQELEQKAATKLQTILINDPSTAQALSKELEINGINSLLINHPDLLS